MRAVGNRLEQEAQDLTQRLALSPQPKMRVTPALGAIGLQIDAGYLRARPQLDGTRSIVAVASKIVYPGRRQRTHAHAYATGYDPHQGLRQQMFLASVGINSDVPITVLSDGGKDVAHACQLPTAAERILDWFHIGMRFEHLLNAIRTLQGADERVREQIARRAEGAKWLIWHGQSERCVERLEALRRDTGWAGPRNPLGRLIRYLRGCAKLLVNYGQRRARGQPISSAGAESAVDYVIGQRMKRSGHMRWSRAGANALLQVRCATLNGQDIRNFKRWYPPGQRIGEPQAFAAA